MYKTCDIHTHIVPNVDDGAHDLEMSIEMLRAAEKQGVKNIVCTSHSWGNSKNYICNLQSLQQKAKIENVEINLYPGCEIYCDADNVEDVVVGLNNGAIFSINQTKYVLIEFDPDTSASEIFNCVSYIHNSGYYVVVAHVERYPVLFQNKNWNALLHTAPCFFQINAYSLQDETNSNIKAAARELLNEKAVSFIGSDAHTTYHRPYMIKNGINYIYENCDEEYAKDILYRNAERFLNIK